MPLAAEQILRKTMLRTRGAIPESLIARRPDGHLLLAGLLAVYHSPEKDWLILDRHPTNAGERRIRWATMPYAPMLSYTAA